MGGILRDNFVLSTDYVNSPPWRVSKANVLGVSPSSKSFKFDACKALRDQCQYLNNYTLTPPPPTKLTLSCHQLNVLGLGEGQVCSCSDTDIDGLYVQSGPYSLK